MSQIIKAFTGVFLILFMVLVSSGLLITYLGVIEAENTHTAFLMELEDSGLSRTVIASCFQEAGQKGYELELVVYPEEGSPITCRDISSVPVESTVFEKIRVILQYQIPGIMGQEGVMHRFSGYARG